ncbi:zinc finger FYVE domain-containing protein 26 isoform X1 [Myotis myotis]|uniref:Zinc finger FYVE domain-containing protein 26 n=1 Tax=Myotis myotis TaxID=51298 RepID=A0A7J8ATE4_MYOMY|nr:zinc finger FYVE domain-containing protein 26 isoform X1 [Myotis myotis]XP_036166665.1 zinc finger FYVE domain-containing protein 26 isoform X1 [Myotis myotis]KAF6389529.1 zinc finger FYVE-type containing 26 [Myotis myotis]
MHHPFGKEETASQRELFGFFCECLQRGEWELAQACVPQLHAAQGDIPKQVEDILRALVACPHQLRCGPDINPQRLAWVWLLVLEKWSAQEKKLLPAVFRRKLEFLLLSEDLQGNIPEDILKELYEAFSQDTADPVLDENRRPESRTLRLSSEAVSVLLDLLSQAPQPAQALLELLLREDDGPGPGDWLLQKALVDLIRKALRALQDAAPGSPGSVEAIYGALRTLRCPAEPLGAELRLLCEELLEACRTEGSPLQEERLLSCLLHKAGRGLLSLYGHAYAEKAAVKPLKASSSGEVSPDHLDPERAMLSLFSNPDSAEAWKLAYFYCLSNSKHFLEQILVTALTLLKEEDFPSLGCLLDREFRPLRRLLVLLGWTHCQSLASARRLLQTLHRTQDQDGDKLLRDACDGLWAHLEVLEWCVQQSSSPIPKRDLLCHLHGGDSHSVLYSLHHLTNLPALREEEVLKLLQKVPAKEPQQVHNSAGAPGPEHLSQCQNLTLYHSFCAMKYAIYALCVNSHQHTQCQECKDSLSEDLAVAAEPVNNSVSPSGASNLFSTYLARCQQYLCGVPDSLRLELLENIFSLLLITSADLHPEPHLPEDYAEEDDIEGKDPLGLRSPPESPQHIAQPERKSERGSLGVPRSLADTLPSCLKTEPKDSSPEPHGHSFLDLEHLTSGVSGFLADEFAMGAVLRLLQDQLEELSSHSPPEDPMLPEGQNCPESRHGPQSRLHRFSKVLSEAQWRYKVVTSNQSSEEQPFRRYRPIATWHPRLRRGRRTRRSRADGRDSGSNPSLESTSSELSTSTSEGSLNIGSARNELQPQTQSSFIPMMFSPPESLLASCILRGNFAEAHQVVFMFDLKSSPSSGELMFMERYQEVIQELARVEHKIENQNSDGGSSTIRRTGSGRSTLQAIGSAAAAGMVFYSISDVTDKLLSPSGDPIPILQEDFWISSTLLEPTDPLREVLEELSPPAMAAFDLACSQCQLWKTCKQLLETAERRLSSSLESRGRQLDHVLPGADGIRGFPVVLQQISKILNYLLTSAGQTKSESVEEKGGGLPRCSIAELLQTCWPSLTEDCAASHATLSQQLDQILQSLREALELPEPRSSPLSSLVEQAAQKAPEVEAHPVRIQTELLQKTLGRQAPVGSGQMDYMGTFSSYCSTLAAVLVQSLRSEPDHVEVRVGNPFVLLQQSSSQLVSHLLLERQVPPDRIAALLAREGLSLSVPQVIVNCCCEPLALSPSLQSQQVSSLLTHLGILAQLHTSHCLEDLPLPAQSSPKPTENPTSEKKPSSSSKDSSPSALTSSALAFLKSRSKLLAIVACLGASRGSKVTKPSLSWKELRGRREVPLTAEQVARECVRLLEQFPMLEASLLAAWEPLRGSSKQEQSLAASLCGQASLSTVLLGLHSPVALDVLTEAFKEALVARDWPRALQLTEMYGRDMDDLSSIRDAVLSCAVASDEEGWQYLFPVKDASLRSQLALKFVDRWPLESCLEILAYCISDTTVRAELRCELRRKLAELQMYQKILGLQATPVWCDWQTLRNCCVEDPSTVMNVILEAKEYGLCEEWGCLYPIPREHLISLHQRHLLYLLEGGDHEKALQLLQRIPDPSMCLEVTEQSLDQHPSLATSHFLANYLTTHFYGKLTAVRHCEIQALYMGSKVLLTLPEQHRASYSHLSSKPLLMLEQLLMNMKVDWATVAVQTLHPLLARQEIGFTMDDVDSLLSRYAGKALDFPYSLREKRSDSEIHLQETVGQASDLETLTRSPSAEFSPATAPGQGVTLVRSPSPKERSVPQSQPPLEFVPPATPPGRHQWVPDESESLCMVCCREHFTMFNRRHHCRRCGRLVCSSCSTKKMVVEGYRENPTRVCDQCYGYYNKDGPEENPGQPEAPDSAKNESPPYSAVVRVPKAPEVEWILDLNEEENELVRNEFYYEQAPSASLCIAILNLHRDSVACGHQLIEHCCRLSQGLANPEVDAGLLTDIMKQLLFSAKVMFVKAGRSQDLALCDSYISKVDVLNILVAAAYRHVPSLDQILQPAAVTRLRNQLLEAEYYQLGVEVSTKTGLDPTGAWHAWGMACLKAGNLTAAREKFSRCLKPPFDLNQLSHGSRLVQDVVEYLESTVRPLLSLQDDDYLATLKELEATLRTQSLSLEVVPEGKIMNNTYYQECLFYLHNYSTNLAIISFYVRHSCLREALLHLLNKESPPEVFIEGIFQPSYKSGKLHVLENLLESIDPTLECWGEYLLAACQHLQKKNYYHILYELQQFMKDQVRAAMTCIRFFSHKAKTYTELGEKLSWLLKAKDHLKIYLQETSRSSKRKKTNFFRKKMSAADVSRHMNTLQLQMEVTRFLHRCESAGTSQITTLPLPTLFGNNHMKMDVACKIMLGGKNVEDGFGMAFRVLQDFQLDAAATYCRAARQLVEREKYSEIRQLLKCVSESGMAAKSDGDTILLNCLEAFKRIPPQELEGLIQAIHNDDNKVQAYLTCCKLRSAYLIAVKQEHSRATALVQQVQQAAKSSGDAVVQDICAQWLLTSQARGALGSGSRK